MMWWAINKQQKFYQTIWGITCIMLELPKVADLQGQKLKCPKHQDYFKNNLYTCEHFNFLRKKHCLDGSCQCHHTVKANKFKYTGIFCYGKKCQTLVSNVSRPMISWQAYKSKTIFHFFSLGSRKISMVALCLILE